MVEPAGWAATEMPVDAPAEAARMVPAGQVATALNPANLAGSRRGAASMTPGPIETSKYRASVETWTHRSGPPATRIRLPSRRTSPLEIWSQIMAIRIVGKRLEGGPTHEHISYMWWIGPVSDEIQHSSRTAMVKFIETQNGQAYVTDGVYTAYLYVNRIGQGPKFVQTYADSIWTDDLLALPDM